MLYDTSRSCQPRPIRSVHHQTRWNWSHQSHVSFQLLSLSSLSLSPLPLLLYFKFFDTKTDNQEPSTPSPCSPSAVSTSRGSLTGMQRCRRRSTCSLQSGLPNTPSSLSLPPSLSPSPYLFVVLIKRGRFCRLVCLFFYFVSILKDENISSTYHKMVQ